MTRPTPFRRLALAATATVLTTAPALAAPRDIMPVLRFDPQVPVLPADGTPAFETTVLLDGHPTTLDLELHSVRGPDFRLVVQDATGEHEVVAPPPRTYRGTVVGVVDSHVAATMVDGALTAMVAMPDGTVYGVQPARELLPGAPDALLCQFRDFWNIVYQGVSRDVAHLMTSRDLDGTRRAHSTRSEEV